MIRMTRDTWTVARLRAVLSVELHGREIKLVLRGCGLLNHADAYAIACGRYV